MSQDRVVTITINGAHLDRLRDLLYVEHEHFDGMNECSICDQCLIEAACKEIEALRKKK